MKIRKFGKTIKIGGNLRKLAERPEKSDENGETEDDASTAAPSWLMTTRAQQKEGLKEQRLANRRAPEMWLKDRETKEVRFRQPEALACLRRYSVRVNGKWQQFTAPAQGDTDLFVEELGLRPAFKAIYEVIDIDGYRDKNGKQIKNVSRFFVGNSRVYEMLEVLRKQVGPLNEMNIKITRSGEGTSTTYSFIHLGSSQMTSEMRKAEKLHAKLAEYYKPLTEDEQRVIVNSVQRTGQTDSD